MKSPHWDLDEVKRLAAEPDGIWVQVGRAANFFGGDARAAMAAAREEIARLTLRSFSATQRLTWNIADVYGIKRTEGGWYLKLYIDQETQVTVISFHPLERPLKTNGGWIRP